MKNDFARVRGCMTRGKEQAMRGQPCAGACKGHRQRPDACRRGSGRERRLAACRVALLITDSTGPQTPSSRARKRAQGIPPLTIPIRPFIPLRSRWLRKATSSVSPCARARKEGEGRCSTLVVPDGATCGGGKPSTPAGAPALCTRPTKPPSCLPPIAPTHSASVETAAPLLVSPVIPMPDHLIHANPPPARARAQTPLANGSTSGRATASSRPTAARGCGAR